MAAAQLWFAAAGLVGIGLLHGASDLALVPAARRVAFVACYLTVAGGVLLWWIGRPAVALPALLLLSIVHFAVEDGAAGTFPRIAAGLLPVAGPAVLHPAAVAGLLAAAGGDAAGAAPPAPASSTAVRAGAGGAAAAIAGYAAARRGDARTLASIAALLLLPPLIGFTLGFLALHALPQTVARMRRLGSAGLVDYLTTTAPLLAGAVAALGVVAWFTLGGDGGGTRALFAGIAALAVPHMVVTPLFEARADRRPGALNQGPGRPFRRSPSRASVGNPPCPIA